MLSSQTKSKSLSKVSSEWCYNQSGAVSFYSVVWLKCDSSTRRCCNRWIKERAGSLFLHMVSNKQKTGSCNDCVMCSRTVSSPWVQLGTRVWSKSCWTASLRAADTSTTTASSIWWEELVRAAQRAQCLNGIRTLEGLFFIMRRIIIGCFTVWDSSFNL